MQNKKLKVWLPLLLSLMIVLGMFIGYSIRGNMPGKGLFYQEKRTPLNEVMDLIDSKYVDTVNKDSIDTRAISGMLSKLDPHSVLLPVEDLKQMNEEFAGHFFGIGIEYNMFQDTINVLHVLPGGPSARAGVMVGDKLIKVDDSLIIGKKATSTYIRKMLRGPEGTTVNVSFLRDNKPISFKIKREGIPIYSLDASYMINQNTGYIRLNKFSETTYKEFMQAAEKLQKTGMQNMILDLRDNGGGILTEATDIADEFLDGDKLITYTQGVHSTKKEYRCKRQGIFEKGKVVILANEGTASASEVLIGALQDWDRATVVGRRTFGKGLVQEQYQLSDGSGLRLTVARYYTPVGRSIQKSYSAGNAVYMDELHRRYFNKEMVSADSIKHTNEIAYKTPAGKTVYSGGGITPDIFVPIDTLQFSRKLANIYMKESFMTVVTQNYLANKNSLHIYKSSADFEKNYVVPTSFWDNYKKYAQKDSVNLSSLTVSEQKEIEKQFKLFTAELGWNVEGLYEASNVDDPAIKRALEILTK